jgi:CheY-like chemotaxis protein
MSLLPPKIASNAPNLNFVSAEAFTVCLYVLNVILCLIYVRSSKNKVTICIYKEDIMGKVLILSDKPLLTKKEEKTLTKAGLQVTALFRYSMYNEYLIKTGRLDYDVIVIDDTLRNVDVYETCHLLRSASKAIIILLGNMPSKEMWEKCKDIGFDRYYKKPIQPRELADQIMRAMDELESKASPVISELSSGGLAETAANIEIAVVKKSRIESMPVSEKAVNIACQTIPDLPAASDNTPNIWHDPKIANLISSLLKGKIKQLSPEIDLGFDDGFSYREAESIMGTTGKETVLILESLAKQGLLLKRDFEKILVSPGGSVQLVPVEKCPTCDSSQLTRGQLIEHFSCGHIGLEEEFMRGFNQVCPKCHRELKLIGTDYRKPGMRYVCSSCHGIFPSPVVKSRCLKTGEVYRLEELHYILLYAYSLNETYRQKLEFELEPKKQLMDYLVRLGYDVQESVQVQGRSGANHKIDILASMDDLITRHTVAIGILAASNDETDVSIDPLFNFDSKIYDTGIDSKMVIAVPTFTPEAMKFAERQGIRVYSLEELRALLSWKGQLNQIIAVDREEQLEMSAMKPDMNNIDPRVWLKWLLEKRGYSVEEKLKVMGRSGAEHILDLYAQKDDGIINHRLAACVITAEDVFNSDVNEVMQFDTAAYDASIRDKVLISVPALSKEARQFAEYQRIKILEAKDLTGFSTRPVADNAARDLSALLNKQ